MMRACIEPLGDDALTIRLGDRIDANINATALALADALPAAGLPGIRDVAPAYASVGVRYDIATWADPSGAGTAYERIAARLADLAGMVVEQGPRMADDPGHAVEVPVCYGGEFGPDLAAVAAHARIDADEVVRRHARADYRVAMLGFMPGFPYLLGLDASLHVPRRPTPRTRVPAGSVAIGGAQTGIYPRELPGGWQLIGRTPLALFDPGRNPPALLAPGMRVRFRPVDAAAFAELSR